MNGQPRLGACCAELLTRSAHPRRRCCRSSCGGMRAEAGAGPPFGWQGAAGVVCTKGAGHQQFMGLSATKWLPATTTPPRWASTITRCRLFATPT